jgi:hypothetical protein
MYKHGTIMSVTVVAKRMPNPSEIAIGIMNLACLEVSNIIGANPPNVVSVVNKIGRKRLPPA